MNDDRLKAYLRAYIHDRQLAPSSTWEPGEGRFFVIPGELANYPSLDPLSGLPTKTANSITSGAMRLTPIAVPLRQLAEEALRGATSSMLYVHEPYLTKEDDAALVDPLADISGQLYAKWPSRSATALQLAEQMSEYFVTWSFLLIRGVAEAPDVETLFVSADLIAVAAFAGEGFVVWKSAL